VRKVDIRRMAQVFGALSNPHRLEILSRLSGGCLCGSECRSNGGGCRCIADLAEELGIAPSTMSHHLKELRQAGLIEMERRGQRTDCCVKPDALKELEVFLRSELS
jgi:ArsR family transcriptional regulator